MRPVKIELRGIDCISRVVYWYFHYNSQLELPQNSRPNINVPLSNTGLQVVTVTINSRFQALPVNSELKNTLSQSLLQVLLHISRTQSASTEELLTVADLVIKALSLESAGLFYFST